MLDIVIPSVEFYDESKNEFIQTKEYKIRLEHSLVSLSKWEATWNKPFLSDENKTLEETIDYIRCMTLTQNVSGDAYKNITDQIIVDVNNYISKKMTATTITVEGPNSKEIITSEIIYSWMISLNIPLECQKWHLNRLLTLVKVCNIQNQPPKKMNRNEMIQKNKDLNAQRKSKMNTRG